MKALFLIFHGFEESNGITKKIRYQIKALQECGIEVSTCYTTNDINGTKKRFIDDKVLINYGNGIRGKILKRFEFNSIANYIINNNIEFVYLRSYHNANPSLIAMLQKIKKNGVKIVMEIPTFPYDQEYITLQMKMELLLDKCFRKKMAKQLDAVVTFTDHKEIFGKKTICISNGIDFDSIKIKNRINDISNSLNLIGVAEIHYWHGFDRLIKGLHEYYNTNPQYKIYFHLVGEFSSEREEKEILPLIQNKLIAQYIILHGKQHGEELDKLFDLADMGIGSLARHRSGITNIKTLKNREYAARGIPFIYSEIDSDFDDMPYVLKIPADESPIDINKLICFYRRKKWEPTSIRESIKNLSWKEQMKNVLKHLDL